MSDAQYARNTTPPRQQSQHDDHNGDTPSASTFSPILPKAKKRSVGGQLPISESTSSRQQQRPASGGIPLSLLPPQRQEGNSPRPSALRSTLRQSLCATLAAVNPGRLSYQNFMTPAPEEPATPPPPSTNAVGVELFLATEPPKGRYVMMNLLSTWGDLYEVGLNAVEMFDGSGARIVPQTSNSSCCPFQVMCDVVTPLEEDQRGLQSPSNYNTVQQHHNTSGEDQNAQTNSEEVKVVLQKRHDVLNLVNGVTKSSDEQQMFVTPFSDGNHHLICFVFQRAVELSAIRIFNYSGGGRSKANKGARLVEITVDDGLAFRGEIRQAVEDDGFEGCETILFTEDEAVLRAIAASTAEAPDLPQQDDASPQLVSEEPTRSATSRNKKSRGKKRDSMRGSTISFAPVADMPGPSPSLSGPDDLEKVNSLSLRTAVGTSAPCVFPAEAPRGVTSACIHIVNTWGDANFVGLSGIRFRDAQGCPIYAIASCVLSRPSGRRDQCDDETAALFDNDPTTACAWVFEPGLHIVIAFSQPVSLAFVEIANYSLGKKTHCGVKTARLFLSTTPIVGSNLNTGAMHFSSVWDEADAQHRRDRHVTELTPPEGVVLRKAPQRIVSLRFQSFDLSLASYGGASAATDNASMSLRLSMNTRAAVAMRRARQSLLTPPEWLTTIQPYIPSILPVGYVFKVTATLTSESKDLPAIKQMLSHWAVRPMESCVLVTDDGTPFDSAQLWCEGLISYGDADEDSGEEDTVSVAVTLVYVSDTPFAISALLIRSPLELLSQGVGEAQRVVCWLRHVRVSADDVVVYEGPERSAPNKSSDSSNETVIQPIIFFTLDEKVLNVYRQYVV